MVRPWSPIEEKHLTDCYATSPLGQLSIDLNRTPSSIKAYAKRLGLNKPPEMRPVQKPLAPGARSRQGFREDLGVSVRSPWEANLARVLTSQGRRWLYEPRTFEFPTEVKGSRTYTPDFYLPDEDIWIEVKGQLKSDGRSKLRKFAKYYPDEFSKLQAVPGSPTNAVAAFFVKMGVPILVAYNVLRYDHALTIPNWEHDSTSAKWPTSKRKRVRPNETVIVPPPPAPRRKKGTDERPSSSPRPRSKRVYTSRSKATPKASRSRTPPSKK